MLMRVICGLVLPTMGTVSIDGEIIGKGISFPRSIGLLLENPIFIDEFTGAKIFLFSVISNDLFRKRRLAIRCVVSTEPIRQKALPQIFSRHEAAPWNRSRYR